LLALVVLGWLVWFAWPWLGASGDGELAAPLAENRQHVELLSASVLAWEGDAEALASEPALVSALASDDGETLSRLLLEHPIAARFANALVVDADYRVRAHAKPTRWAGLRVPRAGDPLARALESSRVVDGAALGPLAANAGLAVLHVAAPLRQDGRRLGTLVLVAGTGQFGALLDGNGTARRLQHEVLVAIDGAWYRLEAGDTAGARLSRQPPDAERDRLLVSASTGGQDSGSIILDTGSRATLAASNFAPLNAVVLTRRVAPEPGGNQESRPSALWPMLVTVVLGALLAGGRGLIGRRDNAPAKRTRSARPRLEPKFREMDQPDGSPGPAPSAREVLVAALSPELRAPLAAILGTAELAMPEATDPRLAARIARIRDSAEDLLAYLDDLALLVGLETGTAPPRQQQFLLRDLLRAVSERCAEPVEAAGSELVLRRGVAVPDIFVGDGERLADIVARLVHAALTQLREGRPLRVIIDTPGSDGVDGTAAGQEVLLRVMVHAGDPLLPGEEPLAEATPIDGLGGGVPNSASIGLVVAARAVESMGGDALWLGSGESPVLGFELPVGAPRPVASTSRALRDHRVLIVDEIGVCGDALAEIFARAECEVHQAPTLAAAGNEIRRSLSPRTRPYDLLLVDERVPDIGRLGELVAGRAEGRALPPVVLVVGPARPRVEGAVADARIGRPIIESEVLELALVLLGLAPAAVATEVADTRAMPASPALAGRRLLLVDDIAINREVGVELLQRAGAAVDTANDGRAAVDAIAAGRRYHAVLMDVEMPVLDGLDATREIRALESGRDLPIIGWSAHVLPADRSRCLAAGMSDYLMKPVAPERLYATVARWTAAADPVPTAPAVLLESLPADPRTHAPMAAALDTAAALRHLGDDRRLFRRLLSTFASDHGRDEHALRSALVAGRRGDAREAAHALKGLAATLGMAQLARVAGSIELSLRAGSAVPDGILDALRDRLDDAVSAAQAWLQEDNSTHPPGSPRTRTDLNRAEFLATLDRQIAGADLDALATFDLLESTRGPDADEAAWEEVRNALMELDFERAAALRSQIG
jgi:CheY-like chemotaxis protein/HPt (histidine-containing phosphotransfer) domain-containing protein/signal transduction histidine kinase